MRKLLIIALELAVSSVMMAEGTAMLISDNKQVENSWFLCFSKTLGLKINYVTSCYGCNLTTDSGMASDVQRILSNKNISEQKPDVVFLQLGCNDMADSEEQYRLYEKCLFDYPYGKVCTKTGTMPRTKTIAISKENVKITNRNFAGSLYRIVNFIRNEVPNARIFILSPIAYGHKLSAADSLKISQIRNVSNMFCVPFTEDFSVVNKYNFIWKKEKPYLGNVLLLGDSYCRLRKWTDQLERLSSVTLINLGKVSATLKECAGNDNTIYSQLSLIPSKCTPDAIIIEGGINDEADQQRFVDDYDSCIVNYKRTTFAGALAYIVRNLRNRFPKAKIYVVTPGGLYYGHTDQPFDFIVKSDQIRKAAKLLRLHTIDWDREGRLSFVFNNSRGTGNGSDSTPFIYNVSSRETNDLLHPNEIGGVYLAENVIKELKEKY